MAQKLGTQDCQVLEIHLLNRMFERSAYEGENLKVFDRNAFFKNLESLCAKEGSFKRGKLDQIQTAD
ncbi:hypothetical protein [Helicobacter felis]|uniref:Uncharacterized protein n=1 Tax=Helicobacter felis (strain ATCC 49179 / CCUG 28539 / NCTC 12436 / CS1) TaxID=936155 RepID=E7AAU0_HELFC|nr:hypothetical protein [Helicobacter felis]CBY82761.1 putative uncharacterized protein [Helicobacter felis ATCC 49179]